ncbi:PadR family transcriptional regulator [Streptomyces sp. TP-A0356]|uniref:PadR family transcriptional regulator n=1 Tax=Streptomyces sp. TP-A0356 TaxID=1359208 RepID=UPI0006E369F1|nr:PadR family transcriptional regulator [Streptomyces sp. TP-A0356]
MDSLNATAATLLGFLHTGEASGYELVAIAEELVGDFWTVTRSQVYRELAALAERGLVTAGDAGPRARVPYRLTEAGREAFAQWIVTPPGTEQIRYPLLLTIAFGGHLDRDRLLCHVDHHRTVHRQRLKTYQARLETAGIDAYQRATLAFGIRYEEAVLAWMDDLPAILGPSD